jgi:hypothetical protein
MVLLYQDPHFTFRFAADWLIPRFHSGAIEAGRRVSVFQIEPNTGERLGLLATAVGDRGWMVLSAPDRVAPPSRPIPAPADDVDSTRTERNATYNGCAKAD